jgi:hypothetical protein
VVGEASDVARVYVCLGGFFREEVGVAGDESFGFDGAFAEEAQADGVRCVICFGGAAAASTTAHRMLLMGLPAGLVNDNSAVGSEVCSGGSIACCMRQAAAESASQAAMRSAGFFAA